MGILDLIFPHSCIECGKGSKYFCNNCLKKITVLNSFDPLTQTFTIFPYKGITRKGIVKIKYNFAFDLAKELTNLCLNEINKNPNIPKENVILIPIPLHKTRQNWRGFNQSEIIGKLIAKGMNWQYDKDLLIRTSAGKNQVGLHGYERVRNIRGKYAVNPEARLYQNNTYIVFDDVLTTGSTIKEAIKILKKAGTIKVIGLTIAR